jgi:hypothetical protein
MLPRVSITAMEAVPNGDNDNATYTIRHTFFLALYQNYKEAEAH